MINLTNEYRMSESLEPQLNIIFQEATKNAEEIVSSLKERRKAKAFDDYFESEFELLVSSYHDEYKKLPISEQARFKSDIKNKTLTGLRKK